MSTAGDENTPAAAYQRQADDYDRRWATYNERSLEMLRPHLSSVDAGTVLDLSCGTGNLIPRLADWGVRVDRYVGVDVAPAMLARAAGRASAAPFPAELVAADAGAIPLRHGSIDTLVTASAMHDWTDASTVLREVRRVLRPGGRLLLMDWRRGRVTMRAIDRILRLRRDPFTRMYSSTEALKLLHDAGFRVHSAERRAITWAWELMLFSATAE